MRKNCREEIRYREEMQGRNWLWGRNTGKKLVKEKKGREELSYGEEM